MGSEPVDIDLLREDIEKLVLLEEVAERRQQLIEKRLEDAVAAGVSAERIREELRLSAESMERLLSDDPPKLAERLGISKDTAEDLAEDLA
jgi:hypothetical protein